MFHYKKLKLSKVYFILCNIYQKKPKRKYTEILTEICFACSSFLSVHCFYTKKKFLMSKQQGFTIHKYIHNFEKK